MRINRDGAGESMDGLARAWVCPSLTKAQRTNVSIVSDVSHPNPDSKREVHDDKQSPPADAKNKDPDDDYIKTE